MLTLEHAQKLAAEWFAAWNAHDLDRILAHYAPGFVMQSPYIAQIAGEGSGRLAGRDAVGAYWGKALEKYPDLHFEPLGVLVGADSIVLYYRSIGGRLAAEFLVVDDSGLIASAAAHYA